MIYVQLKYCLPNQVSQYVFVQFDGVEVKFTNEASNATDFKTKKALYSFFMFILLHKDEVRIKDAMFMHFIGRGKKDNLGWYEDCLEIKYNE